MTLAGFDQTCGSLQGAALTIQWKGSHVWKVGGKMFAVAWGRAPVFACSLKASGMAREIYAGQPGIIPAPYLARAGWLRFEAGALPDAELADMIRVAHQIIIAGLPAKKRAEYGLWAD
jgi:predicted DNA-binding protein (MmcQ/YjbR family)